MREAGLRPLIEWVAKYVRSCGLGINQSAAYAAVSRRKLDVGLNFVLNGKLAAVETPYRAASENR
jgi:hypothetical protein